MQKVANTYTHTKYKIVCIKLATKCIDEILAELLRAASKTSSIHCLNERNITIIIIRHKNCYNSDLQCVAYHVCLVTPDSRYACGLLLP